MIWCRRHKEPFLDLDSPLLTQAVKGRSAERSSFLGSSSHMPEQHGFENCSQPCGEPTAEEPGGDGHLVVLRSVLVSRKPLTSSGPWGVVVMRHCLPEGDQVVSGRGSLPLSLIPARATCIWFRAAAVQTFACVAPVAARRSASVHMEPYADLLSSMLAFV